MAIRKRSEGLGSKIKPNSKIPFKNSTKQKPPNDKSVLLIWEEDWGYEVIESFLAFQHINDDIYRLGKPRIKYWTFLEKEKK